jgi:hypothetical protein
MRVEMLVANLSLMPFFQHDPLVHKHLFHNLILRCVREYFRTTHH